MPRVTIRLAESALADLTGIRDWYAEQGVSDVGERLLNEILNRIQTLRDHPEKGRVVPEFEQPALRELIHTRFRIVYRVQGSAVSIVRVWRSAVSGLASAAESEARGSKELRRTEPGLSRAVLRRG